MTATDSRLGVVVMAYGTPRTPDDVEAYYTHIRRGRPPSPEQLADLRRRYDAIGGVSPLAERTEAQRMGLQAALDHLAPGGTIVVLGQKHSAPFVEDAVTQLADLGVGRVVGLVLAPHYSRFSVGEYQKRLREAAEPLGIEVGAVDHWYDEPAYVDFLAGAVTDARATLPADHKIIFTAHSLPERVLVDDPYPDQLRAGAALVADRLGLLPWAGWSIGWQSAGATPEPWRGPDILEVVRELGATGRTDGLLVVPHGFTADHLEVIYDLDIETAAVAQEAGLAFARTRVLNDDATVLAALAERVLAADPGAAA